MEKKEEALRYLDILELAGIVYFASGAVLFACVTFASLQYFLPIEAVVLLVIGILKLFTGWEDSKELVLEHLNRPRIETWDGEKSSLLGSLFFSFFLYLVFALVHYFYWTNHLGRMIQIYLGFSLLLWASVNDFLEEKLKKLGNL